MKSITFVRHGKSSWEFDVLDRDRPLKFRGKNDAKRVAEHYKSANTIPEIIYSSPANRALSTCKIFTKIFEYAEDSINIDESLYDFSGEMVLDFIKALPNTQNNIMIFGHNHAFTSITNLSGSQYIDNLPTAGLVKISFNIKDWKSIETGTTDLVIIPKTLR